MNNELTPTDAAAAVRHARFGTLPERVRYEDMTEQVETTPGGGANTYNAENSWKFYSCVALDLGL